MALDAGYRVDTIFPSAGSLAGGTTIVFSGAGFAANANQIEPAFAFTDNWGYDWVLPCVMASIAADGTNASCVLGSVPGWQMGTANATSTVSGALIFKINNVTAPCAPATNGCGYTQDMAHTPVVTATVFDATHAYITGSNLGAPGAASVLFGGVFPCGPSTPINASTIACVLPAAIAGNYQLSLSVAPLGAGRITANYSFPLSLAGGLAPSSGSAEGGSTLTITGAGFATDDITRNVVAFGSSGRYGLVIAATPSSLTLLSPASPSTTGSASAHVDVTVYVQPPSGASGDALPVFATLPAAFTYDASTAYTPTLSSISPASGALGTAITLRGSGFTSVNGSGSLTVVIGGEPCSGLVFNDTVITCTLGPSPGGSHRVMVTIDGKGLARTLPAGSPPLRFTSLLTISSIAAGSGGAASSYGGGRILTLLGQGFPTLASGARASIGTCNSACTVLASSYSSVTCAAGPLLSAPLLSAINVWAPAPFMPVSVTPASAASAMDGDPTTPFSACTVTADMGPGTLAIVTSVRYYPTFLAVGNLDGAVYAGSNDGLLFTPIVTLASTGLQYGWNEMYVPGWAPLNASEIDLGAFPSYRYLRVSFRGSSCGANEVEFRGIPVTSSPVLPDGSSVSCGFNVTVSGSTASNSPFSLTGAPTPATATSPAGVGIQYGLAATPVVTGVTPAFGSALGGDTIVLSGTGFIASSVATHVALNSIPCAVVSATASSITCISGPRPVASGIAPISLNVTFDGLGAALVDLTSVYFRYLDRWSALTTVSV